jgi:hypothetical protein
MGDYRLMDAVSALITSIRQPVAGYTVRKRYDLMIRIPLFFREKCRAIRHEEPKVAGVWLIDEREIDLVQNAMRRGEPKPAVARSGCTYSGL